MDSKKIVLLLLPLLLTACSSVQLKREQPKEAGVIRYQPPVPSKPINIFRCFEDGAVEGESVRSDVMRNLDRGHVVTIYFIHEDGFHYGLEGILQGLTADDRLVLSVLEGFDHNGPVFKGVAIPVGQIEFVLVRYTKEELQ